MMVPMPSAFLVVLWNNMGIVYTMYMHEFKRKRSIDRIIYSPVVLIVLTVILGFSIRATWAVYEKEQTSRDALALSQRELDKVATREQTLNQAIAYLSTPQGVETEIRKKFRVVKDGEEVAVILDDVSGTVVASSSPARGGILGLWDGLLHLIGVR